MGRDDGVEEAAAKCGVGYGGEVKRTERGTPILRDAFMKAASLAKHDLLCYVNADIIFMDDFLNAVDVVLKKCQSKDFVMVGRRWGLDVDTPIDFAADWQAQLKTRAFQEGELFTPAGSDYFVFRPGLSVDMPAFAVGRPFWDNWIMYHARHTKVPLVDATAAITVVHQNHDYQHISGGKTGAWTGLEAKMNYALAGGGRAYYTVYNATHLIREGELVSTYQPRYLWRHGRTWLWRSAVRFAAKHPVSYRRLNVARRTIFGMRPN